MARDLHDIISDRREGFFDPPFQREGSDDAFLQLVIQPIYSVMQKVFAHRFLLMYMGPYAYILME
jgi:hypothetical protein